MALREGKAHDKIKGVYRIGRKFSPNMPEIEFQVSRPWFRPNFSARFSVSAKVREKLFQSYTSTVSQGRTCGLEACNCKKILLLTFMCHCQPTLPCRSEALSHLSHIISKIALLISCLHGVLVYKQGWSVVSSLQLIFFLTDRQRVSQGLC